MEEILISTSGIQTPTRQERKVIGDKQDHGKEPEKEIGSKRPREDQSHSVTGISSKQFKLKYRKRARIHMDIDQGDESEKQTVLHIRDTPGSSPVGGQIMPPLHL